MKSLGWFVILYLCIFQQVSAKDDYDSTINSIQQKMDQLRSSTKINLESIIQKTKSLREIALSSVDNIVKLWEQSTTWQLDDLREEIKEMGLNIDEGILGCLGNGEDELKQLLVTISQKTQDCVSETVEEISDYESTVVLHMRNAYDIIKRFTSHTCEGHTLTCMDQMRQDMDQSLIVLGKALQTNTKGEKTLSKFEDNFNECFQTNYVLLNSTFQEIYAGTVKCMAPNLLAQFNYNISIKFQEE